MSTLGRICKLIPPPCGTTGGGGRRVVMEPLPSVFDMMQYAVFQNDFAFTGKPFISQKDEVFFMGGGAAGGPLTSLTMDNRV